MKKVSARDIFFYLLIALVLVAVVVVLQRMNRPVEYDWPEIRQLFLEARVEEFDVLDNRITIQLREPLNGVHILTYELPSFELFYSNLNTLIERQHAEGLITRYNYVLTQQPPWWVTFLPYLALALLFVLIWYFVSRRSGGSGGVDRSSRFSRARARHAGEQDRKVTFADVAGSEEEKAELQEIVEFLRAPRRFTALGAHIPKGVLLVGPPGTGKTLLAKAVAGEADVSFLSISGSDFVELYVGVGASRVRDLFDQAKRVAPAIVFIDEIDAVGRQRGAGLGGGHDEREQTLNQLLVEMDGFGTNEGVIVMAATNRQDILDPALLRPGRFDRQIFVGLPDIKGREDILRVHAKDKPLSEDVELSVLARGTVGFTGADLENLVNEAALLSARRSRRTIGMPEFHDATIKVIAGPEKRSRIVTERTRKLTAYHEAGHAIVMRSLKTHDPVHQISIIPRGQAGGMTIALPREDKAFLSRTEMFEQLVSLMGGRVAEQLALGDMSTGASNDIQRASSLARKMVTVYGMSDKLGPISFETGHDEIFIGRSMAQARTYSEDVAAQIDGEVRRLIDEAYKRCEEILHLYSDRLDAVAEYLLDYETMDATTFEAVFDGTQPLPGAPLGSGAEFQTTDDVRLSSQLSLDEFSEDLF